MGKWHISESVCKEMQYSAVNFQRIPEWKTFSGERPGTEIILKSGRGTFQNTMYIYVVVRSSEA